MPGKRIETQPEIMIPLVGIAAELKFLRDRAEATIAAVMEEKNSRETSTC
jgi:pyruvate, orthophosphate dikinase